MSGSLLPIRRHLQVTKSTLTSRFFEGYLPFLIAYLANFVILVSTLVVILFFPTNSSLPLSLANSPGNFPLGSLTAVFSPDTQVFLDFASWQSWYSLTASNFLIFLALFFILNWNVKRRERGIRLIYYSLVFLVLPVVANILNILLIDQSTLGPSGAYYSSVGLLVGFGLVNLWAGDKGGGLGKLMERGKLDAVIFILNGTVATGFLLLSFVDPTDFFSEVVAGYTVGYGIHMFCFYSAVVAALFLSYLRRSSLVPRQVQSIDQELPK